MFDSVLKQYTGEGAANSSGTDLHAGLDTLLGQATSGHASGAVGEALQALGVGGFAQSVQSSAQHQTPAERGQVGSMLLQAIEHGGGNPSNVLSSLGIGGQDPSAMSHQNLGSLAGYVAQNHGSALSSMLGGAAGGAGSGGGGLAGTAIHLLGNPMVQQTAMSLARRLL